MPALQAQSPEFKTQYHHQKKKNVVILTNNFTSGSLSLKMINHKKNRKEK
jgi:hypothetical protein